VSTASSQSGIQPVTEAKQADRSLGELFADLGGELGLLVRKELELAKTEARIEAIPQTMETLKEDVEWAKQQKG